MIKLDNVCLSYRSGFLRLSKQVLKSISFTTEENTITGYLGVNGAGKTSTIKLVAGINRPNSGEITVDGESPYVDETRHKIGYLPENPYFYEYLTPREALDLYGKLHEMDRIVRRKRAEELLDRADMLRYADQQVRGFSKGMRQRLGLVQALIHDPKLLLLDEPLTGLDPMGRLLLRDLISSEKSNGRSIFFSSHVLSDVEAICDNLIILNAGQIAFAGAQSDLLAQMKSNATRIRFLGPEALPESIQNLPWSVKPVKASRGYEGQVSTLEEGQKVLAALHKEDMTVLTFQATGLSLEEYFLKTFGDDHGKALEGKDATKESALVEDKS